MCVASCSYCSFQRKPGAKDAYVMRLQDVIDTAKSCKDITELHIVNGLHPTLPWKYYVNVLSTLKKELPNVYLKAFTATEIHWFEHISKLSLDEILDTLIDAGLSSLTGGGAEIFNWEVRKNIVDHNTHWEDWSRIHRAAHNKGIKTPCTMLYGHVEEWKDRIDHLLRLRTMQDETKGFQVFIPLRYQFGGSHYPKNNLEDKVPNMANTTDIIKTFAISRLMLDNIPNIKVFWVMHGLENAQLALLYGANDIDGSVVEYKITHDADNFGTPSKLSKPDLISLIKEVGFIPVERDTYYNTVYTY